MADYWPPEDLIRLAQTRRREKGGFPQKELDHLSKDEQMAIQSLEQLWFNEGCKNLLNMISVNSRNKYMLAKSYETTTRTVDENIKYFRNFAKLDEGTEISPEGWEVLRKVYKHVWNDLLFYCQHWWGDQFRTRDGGHGNIDWFLSSQEYQSFKKSGTGSGGCAFVLLIAITFAGIVIAF